MAPKKGYLLSGKRGSRFPREFLRIINGSGLTHSDVARMIGIGVTRFHSLINGPAAMDSKEFKLLSNFCAAAQNKMESGGTASNT